MLLAQYPEFEVLRDAIYDQHPQSLPAREDCLRALTHVGLGEVRAVILGQDPYHTPGKANGFAFGYNLNYNGPIDSSLENIMAEAGLEERNGTLSWFDPSLESWADQGVLLLNTRLSVRPGAPMSHARFGWEELVRKLLRRVHHEYGEEVVYLTWGREARGMLTGILPGLTGIGSGNLADLPNVIVSSHPCRFSHKAEPNPFTGSDCFRRANDYLISIDKEPIKWV